MIVCLGPTPTVQRSMTFAKLSIDDVNRAKSVHEYASGKSVNAARVLHTLGEKVLATGFVGGDRAVFFRHDLDAAGISHDFVTVDSPTRLCTTVVDESAGTATELIEESYPVKFADYESLLKKVRSGLLVLSGTLPPGASDDFYARCAAGRKTILDAVGLPLLKALPQKPFVIKPNQSEVARTFGTEIDSDEKLKDAMKELVARGATWVVTTRGKQGALITNGQSFWQVNTPQVKVVSAIGSGDSFAGGLAAGISRGQDVPQACILAAACGSANAMTPYAGHIHLADVEALTKQIRLESLTR